MNLNPAWPGCFGHRQRERQHAVAHLSLDLLRVRALRQWHAAAEAAVTAFEHSIALLLATHFALPALSRIKSGLHVPELLDKLGASSLSAYVDTHADWKSRLFDAVLKLYPSAFDDHCRNPICHRIAFLYGPGYKHDQLNAATHDAMHELFGDATITAFEHLAQLSRAKHLVAADGTEIYLDQLSRMAVPTLFLHGADNGCFLPSSTEESFGVLSQVNPARLYQRRVIPGYGHGDCIIGKHAAQDVYPLIVEHLDANP